MRRDRRSSPPPLAVRPLAVRALRGLLLVALAAGVLPFLAGLLARYTVVEPAAGPGPRPVEGAYHVHTRRSDGRGTVEEVAAAARAAGLAFVVLTDHNVPPGPPRWVDGVLLVDGVELSTRHGHLVALREPAPGGALGGRVPVEEARRAGADPVAVVAAAGGMSVLAHPVQRKNPWRDWSGGARAEGFELYSADTLFREALAAPLTRLWPAVWGWLGGTLRGGTLRGGGVHGVLALVGDAAAPRERMLALPHPPVALCAHDAHGAPPYADVFHALSLALPLERLPEDAGEAAAAVVGALRRGEATCVFRALGAPPPGFRLEGLEGGARRVARVGQRLEVPVPAGVPAQVRVWGAAELEPDGRTVRLARAGLAHVEVWLEAPGRWLVPEWRPWLVPSPLEVLAAQGDGAGSEEGRRAAGSVPPGGVP